jgi:hypothetical protein
MQEQDSSQLTLMDKLEAVGFFWLNPWDPNKVRARLDSLITAGQAVEGDFPTKGFISVYVTKTDTSTSHGKGKKKPF